MPLRQESTSRAKKDGLLGLTLLRLARVAALAAEEPYKPKTEILLNPTRDDELSDTQWWCLACSQQ
jgi:hypothetical protein